MTEPLQRQDIRIQQLRHMQQRVLQGSMLNAGVGILVAILMRDDMPSTLLAGWLTAVLLTNGLRVIISYLSLDNRNDRSLKRLMVLHTLSAGLNGLSWGACTLLFPDGTSLSLLSQTTIILLAILAAGSFNQAAHMPSSTAFALGMSGPMLASTNPIWSQSSFEYPLLLSAYLVAILLFTRRYNQQLLNAIRLAEDKRQLADQLHDEVAVRAQLEETARQAEKQLGTLIDTAPDGILVVNEQGRIVLANAEAHRLFGYEPSTLIDQPVEKLVPARYAQNHVEYRNAYNRNPVRRPIQTGKQLLGLRQDGSEFPIEIGLSSVATPTGTLTYAAVHDLTMGHYLQQIEHEMEERRKAEEALQRLNAQQSAILNGTRDHIARLDAQGHLIWWNKAVEADLGLTADQLQGCLAYDLVPPAEQAIIKAAFQQAAIAGSSDVEVHLLTATGPRLFEFSGVSIKDASGQLNGFVTIGRDIEQKRENEHLVVEAQRAAHLAHWRWSPARRVFAHSQEATHLLGLPEQPAQLALDDLIRATHPDDRQSLQQLLDELKGPGDSASMDIRICWPDDSLHWLHLEARTIIDARGDVHELRGTMQDITERKAMEQSLRDSEQRLELAIAGSSDGVWDWDLVSNAVYFSPRWKEMLGFQDHELANRYDVWEQRVHPDDLPPVLQKIQDYLAGKRDRFESEFRMRHKDGHYVHILSRAQLTHDADQQPVRLSGTHADISERKRNELIEQGHRRVYQLLSGESRLPEVLQALVDLVVDVDPDTHCALLLLDEDGQHLSHGASRGLSEEYIRFIESLSVSAENGVCCTAAVTGRTVIAEDLRTHPSNQRHTGASALAGLRACWSHPIIDSSGAVLGVLSSYHETTRAPREEELALLDDAAYLCSIALERYRMQSATRDLQTQLQQAQKMEAIGHLAGGIAHDFNNILATIMGFTDLSRSHVDRGRLDKLPVYLTQIGTATERARDLVKQLLTFSRIQKGTPTPARMDELINEVGTLLRPTLPSSIELDIQAPPLKAKIDQVQMHQVLMNLTLNARDAMEGKGRISLQLAEEHIAPTSCAACHEACSGDYIAITVTDDGPGIAPAMLNRMFEPFASTKEVGKGSGMGLAITHGIIHEHGGHILVDSRPGHTEFKLLLPKATDDAALDKAGTAANDEPQPLDHAGKHILLVDDEVGITAMLGELLEMLDYQVSSFNDSEQALAFFQQDPNAVDLVVTDQTMPRLSGSEMGTAMLALRPDLPIILCTGYSESLTEEGALALGIRAYLMKPVNNTVLVQEIRRQLSPPDDAPAATGTHPI